MYCNSFRFPFPVWAKKSCADLVAGFDCFRGIGPAILFFAIFVNTAVVRADRNDAMFPPPPSVGKAIRVDGQAFVLNGRRTFVASGSMHYARVPRALWANRLLRMKRAGFNTVSSYIFWSFQEPRKGEFLFKGRRNIEAFLALVKKMRMHAILRIGPYNNGEWANGGLPNWLRFIPGLSVRSYNQPFLTALKPYFDRLLPMIAKNQITHGGPVVMVQIENEYSPGWGAVLNNRYLRWLHAIAIKKGIDVPFFFSGLNQGFNPAGNQPFNNTGRTTPWFTTEMWSGWFNAYRNTNPVIRRLVIQSIWRVISFGGCGYNVFMTVGGTNFSHWNCRSVRASYAFGAPIGQVGDLRSSYYQYKRANFFARSFAAILEKSRNATGAYQNFITKSSGKIHIYARRSPSGTIVFLMNPGVVPVIAQVPGGCRVTINPGQTNPVIFNYPIAPWMSLTQICTQVFGVEKMAGTQTLVIYGNSGSTGMLHLALGKGVSVLKASRAFVADKSYSGQYSLGVRYSKITPRLFRLVTTAGIFQVVTESKHMANDTWFVHVHGQPLVVVGPRFLKTIYQAGNHLSLLTQTPLNKRPTPATVFGADGLLAHCVVPASERKPVSAPMAPRLGPWQVRLADAPAQPSFNDKSWTSTPRPRQMGYPDYPGDYQWYRTTIRVAQSGPGTLLVPRISNQAAIFLNGRILAFGNPSQLPVQLKKGDNTLAILTIADDRSKLFSIIGDFRDADRKGLWQPVKLLASVLQKKAVKGKMATKTVPSNAPHMDILGPWRMHGGMGPPNPASGWQPLGGTPGIPCFYRTTFNWHPDVNGIHAVLRVSPGNLSDGYMYINGHNIGRYKDFNMPMGLYLPSCWMKPGKNVLVILDDAGASPAATKLVVEVVASRRNVRLISAPTAAIR